MMFERGRSRRETVTTYEVEPGTETSFVLVMTTTRDADTSERAVQTFSSEKQQRNIWLMFFAVPVALVFVLTLMGLNVPPLGALLIAAASCAVGYKVIVAPDKQVTTRERLIIDGGALGTLNAQRADTEPDLLSSMVSAVGGPKEERFTRQQVVEHIQCSLDVDGPTADTILELASAGDALTVDLLATLSYLSQNKPDNRRSLGESIRRDLIAHTLDAKHQPQIASDSEAQEVVDMVRSMHPELEHRALRERIERDYREMRTSKETERWVNDGNRQQERDRKRRERDRRRDSKGKLE